MHDDRLSDKEHNGDRDNCAGNESGGDEDRRSQSQSGADEWIGIHNAAKRQMRNRYGRPNTRPTTSVSTT